MGDTPLRVSPTLDPSPRILSTSWVQGRDIELSPRAAGSNLRVIGDRGGARQRRARVIPRTLVWWVVLTDDPPTPKQGNHNPSREGLRSLGAVKAGEAAPRLTALSNNPNDREHIPYNVPEPLDKRRNFLYNVGSWMND